MQVKDVFEITHTETRFVIERYDEDAEYIVELWGGTQLLKCEYRCSNVLFMRVCGNPYSHGHILLTIE